MKKKFLLILLTVFMASALAACGEKEENDDDSRRSRVERDKNDGKDDSKDKDDSKANDDENDNSKDRDDNKDNDGKDDSKDRDDSKDNNDNQDEKDPVGSGSEASEICGTWALEYDGSQQLSAELGADISFVFTIMMDFNSDGTMRMYVDADSLKNSVNSSLMPFLVQMMYDQMAEMGLDKAAADDTFQQVYGSTVQEYCESELLTLMEDNLDALTKEFNTTARYRVNGDKLYLTDDAGEFDDYIIFRVNGDTLTLDDPSGADEVEGLKLPLVLKKQ